MTDPRIKTLAKNLIGFSCAIKPGEKILIEGNGECTELVKALVKETYAVGGLPFVWPKKPEKKVLPKSPRCLRWSERLKKAMKNAIRLCLIL